MIKEKRIKIQSRNGHNGHRKFDDPSVITIMQTVNISGTTKTDRKNQGHQPHFQHHRPTELNP
jgi:hypothetical protein